MRLTGDQLPINDPKVSNTFRSEAGSGTALATDESSAESSGSKESPSIDQNFDELIAVSRRDLYQEAVRATRKGIDENLEVMYKDKSPQGEAKIQHVIARLQRDRLAKEVRKTIDTFFETVPSEV